MKYWCKQRLYVLNTRSWKHRTFFRPPSGGRKRFITLVFFIRITCPVVRNKKKSLLAHSFIRNPDFRILVCIGKSIMHRAIYLQVNASNCIQFLFYNTVLKFNVNVYFEVHYFYAIFSVYGTMIWFCNVSFCQFTINFFFYI